MRYFVHQPNIQSEFYILESNHDIGEIVRFDIGITGKRIAFSVDKKKIEKEAEKVVNVFKLVPISKLYTFLNEERLESMEKDRFEKGFWDDLNSHFQQNGKLGTYYSVLLFRHPTIQMGEMIHPWSCVDDILNLMNLLQRIKPIVDTDKLPMRYGLENIRLREQYNCFLEKEFYKEIYEFIDSLQCTLHLKDQVLKYIPVLIYMHDFFEKRILASIKLFNYSKMLIDFSATWAYDALISSFEPIIGLIKSNMYERVNMGSKQKPLYTFLKRYSNIQDSEILEEFVRDIYGLRNMIKHEGYQISSALYSPILFIDTHPKRDPTVEQRLLPPLFDLIKICHETMINFLNSIPIQDPDAYLSVLLTLKNEVNFTTKEDANGNKSVCGTFMDPSEIQGRLISVKDLAIRYKNYYLSVTSEDDQNKMIIGVYQ